MSVFAYDPTAVSRWANEVISYLKEGSNSIEGCSKKFGEQMEKLVQPNVWTGTAAKQNYQNFLECHKALVVFTDSFGAAFQESMTKINANVGALEAANLGISEATNSFGSLDYTQLSALAEDNIDVSTNVIRYDYATIADIGSNLKSINTTLGEVKDSLISKINELNNGTSIWDGDAAENNRQELTRVINENMNKAIPLLETCIANISNAAEAAQQADRG